MRQAGGQIGLSHITSAQARQINNANPHNTGRSNITRALRVRRRLRRVTARRSLRVQQPRTAFNRLHTECPYQVQQATAQANAVVFSAR